jgi:UDP-glucose 4-epimerase
VMAPRRPGDPASMVADAGSAASLLGWKARFGLAEMVASAWDAAMQRAGKDGGEVLIS